MRKKFLPTSQRWVVADAAADVGILGSGTVEEVDDVVWLSRHDVRIKYFDLVAIDRMPTGPDGEHSGGLAGADVGGGVADEGPSTYAHFPGLSELKG